MLSTEDQFKQHVEQYKMLREEIFFHLKETRKLEIYAITGISILYAWLITHDTTSIKFFIGFFIPILGGIRSWVSLTRIKEIAGYLRKLEQAFFTENDYPKGWEIYFDSLPQERTSMTEIAYGFWVVLLLVTIISPFVFGK
jgi:hypothetical protein